MLPSQLIGKVWHGKRKKIGLCLKEEKILEKFLEEECQRKNIGEPDTLCNDQKNVCRGKTTGLAGIE